MRKAGNVRGAALTQLAQACNVKAAKFCQLGQALQAVQPVAASEAEALHCGARCRRHRLQLCAGIKTCQQGSNRQSEAPSSLYRLQAGRAPQQQLSTPVRGCRLVRALSATSKCCKSK